MKKIVSLILVIAMIFAFAVLGTGCNSNNGTSSTGTPSNSSTDEGSKDDTNTVDLKIGCIMVGDNTEGYTLAHINGINAAAEALNISADNIIWKYKVEETDDCYNAAKQLVGNGCNLIIANSYGHQDYIARAAEEFPDVNFVSMTGDYASISGLDNFYNAFTDVYESRYVSGVVAGMKLAELIADKKLTDANYDADGNVKVGYVGAYTYAEVVSGFTAFYLGIKSVVENVSMEVQYTGSWFDIEKEAAAAEVLMSDGCVIIGQHADSTGAPTAVQKALEGGKVAYSIGYNVDMLDVAPDAALTSATNTWEVCYEEIFKAALAGDKLPVDWSEGFSKDAVAITKLGASVADGTEAKVAEVEAAIKDGSLKVFDTSKFTVSGANITDVMTVSADGKLTAYNKDFSCIDFTDGSVIYQGETKNVVVEENGVSYFSESTFRSAPYFDVLVDGITNLNSAY